MNINAIQAINEIVPENLRMNKTDNDNNGCSKETTKLDTFEKNVDGLNICETYNDWSKVKVRSDSVMANSLGDQMFNDIGTCMVNYHAGEYSKEQVKVFMEKCCTTMINYHTWVTPEKELSDEQKQEIVGTIYSVFQNANTDGAVYQCEQEGEKINSEYEYDDYLDYSYYSSDIYYEWKDMKADLLEYANSIGSSVSERDVNYSSYQDNTYKERNFNECWNWVFTKQRRLSKMIDTSVEPPENIKFFYKNSPYHNSNNIHEQVMGRVFITTDRGIIDSEVPFKAAVAGSLLGLDGQVFNISDLLDKLNTREKKENQEFFKNFLIFKKEYGFYYQME